MKYRQARPPGPPPGAPWAAKLVIDTVARAFRRCREEGEDWPAALLVGDEPEAPPMLVPFIDTADADARADVLFAAVELWPFRPARNLIFACDSFVRFARIEEGEHALDLSVAPHEDPKATEALQLIWTERSGAVSTAKQWLGAFPYTMEPEGLVWRAGPGWLDGLSGPLSRQQMALLGGTVSNEELVELALQMRAN